MELNLTVLLQLAIFLTLLAVLSKFLFEPLLRLFNEREQRTIAAAKEAKSLVSSTEAQSAELQAKLAKAQDGARELMNSLRLKGQTREQEILADARNEAQTKIEGARKSIESSTSKIKNDLDKEANAIADDIVKKLLGRAA